MTKDLKSLADDHLWLHFTDMASYRGTVPVIVRGEGARIYDLEGREYLDALSGLLVVQAGHGRRELAEAAARQAAQLGYFPLWGHAHPQAIELAERLAAHAPGDLNKVFFTTGGSEAVETAWKLAKQYFKLVGKPLKHKILSRTMAYHGTTQGALSITGIPDAKKLFEPLVPGARRIPNTDLYRAAEATGVPELAADPERFGRWAADQVERVILAEGADTVAAVIVEPVQNAGGCLPPPPGYFRRLREICDAHDVLLVSDEVICAFGRLGTLFGCERFDYVPDIITCAKGMTSGYSPIGAAIVSDRIAAPFYRRGGMFPHGYTFGGHPVSAAVALANLDLFEREGLLRNVRENEAGLRASLEGLLDLPIVGDVRGEGYFYGIELVRDRETREPFTPEECERLLRGPGGLSETLWESGLYCRADDHGEPVIQLAPPLICGPEEFGFIEQVLRTAITATWKRFESARDR
ncbi:aspartate aminotransferase family protein [Kitasatospora sp. NPDC006697]|uniref:aspartate aminotransferase family protein n=1 Tax=Kitasatospora sp. NPDC006697 TaxID=3364020 RepID=UPI00367929BA